MAFYIKSRLAFFTFLWHMITFHLDFHFLYSLTDFKRVCMPSPARVSVTTYRISKKFGLGLLHYRSHKLSSGSHWYAETSTLSET